MFTEAVSAEQASAFSRFLGVPILSANLVGPKVDRHVYLTSALSHSGHVFLDPDIGIRVDRKGKSNCAAYVFVDELVEIVNARPESLTAVFDQSLARGRERAQLEGKLTLLLGRGIHGFAYLSHACFVFLGLNEGVVHQGFETVRRESRLPVCRFVSTWSLEL
ncbi:MAG: hypothetical protein AB1640_12990 [bacterium]